MPCLKKIRWRAIEEDPLCPPPTSIKRPARMAKGLASIHDALGSILSINYGRKERKNGGRNRRGRRERGVRGNTERVEGKARGSCPMAVVNRMESV